MPITAQELANIAVASLDFHMKKRDVLSQTIQDKPLLAKMRSKERKFPGGKGDITRRVKGIYDTDIQGFEYDDTVTYGNPANLVEAKYPWKLLHWGIKVTKHELLNNSIELVDDDGGLDGSRITNAEAIQLADLLDDKLEDMSEGSDRGMNNMFWEDGTQDAKEVPGLTSFILDDPTVAGVIGGIDQVANPWWQNRANVAINIAGGAAAQPMVTFLQNEYRQLRRYGGRTDLMLAGSDMMDQIEKELREKGNYTETGWSGKGRIDASISDIAFKGIGIDYDPTLDDMGKSKYLYALDCRRIYPMVVGNESRKTHMPARPTDKYVNYTAQTWVGGLVCDQRNAQGVYAFP